MSNETPKTVVARWAEVGQWHMGPAAPNGLVCGRVERTVTELEVFIADYYGKGAKRYMSGKSYLQSKDGRGVYCAGNIINSFQDGNEKYISSRMTNAGF